MTVSTTASKISYVASAAQTTFAYTFKIFVDSDLKVYVNSTQKTLTTDYTVTGAGDVGGGNIIFGTGLAIDDIVIIERVLLATQGTDYVENDPFPADAHEDALDKLTMLIQQSGAFEDRSVRAPTVDLSPSMELPIADTRATKMLGFDADGDPVMSGSTVDDIDASVAAAFAGGVLASSYQFTGTGSQVAFTITGGVTAIPNAQALIITIDGVTQHTDTYTTAAAVVTFSTAPPLNADIQIRYNAYLGTATDAASATYNQGGTGASSRTVENKLQESVSVKDFGAVGDGVTDDTAAFQSALIHADINGLTLIIPSASYILSSWAGYEVTNKLRVLGSENALITLSSPTDAMFSFSAASTQFSMSQVKLTCPTTENLFDLVGIGTLEHFKLTHLIISGFKEVVNADALGIIENLVVSNCYVSGSKNGFEFDLRVKYAEISGNVITDITNAGEITVIHVGKDASAGYTYQDESVNFNIHNNKIKDIESTTSSQVMGILCFGKYISISNNQIENIISVAVTDVEGIYIKAMYSSICNNILFNAGAGDGSIVSKGENPSHGAGLTPLGVGSIISGNLVESGRGAGIYFSGSSTSCMNNIIRSCLGAGISAQKNTTGGLNDIVISGNTIEGCDGRDVLIDAYFDSCRIVDNIMSSEGVSFDLTNNSDTLGPILVTGNILSPASLVTKTAVEFEAGTAILSEVYINNNTCRNFSQFVKFGGSGLMPTLVAIKDNFSDSYYGALNTINTLFGSIIFENNSFQFDISTAGAKVGVSIFTEDDYQYTYQHNTSASSTDGNYATISANGIRRTSAGVVSTISTDTAASDTSGISWNVYGVNSAGFSLNYRTYDTRDVTWRSTISIL